LKILPVKWIDDVLKYALQHLPVPRRSDQVATSERDKKSDDAEKNEAALPH
jgi:hypothetical protein